MVFTRVGFDRVPEDDVSAADLVASEIFANVPESVLAECAARARLVTFPRGAIIARQGDAADAFYLIVDGSVEVVLEHKGQLEEFVDVLRRGDCVGDLALLLGQARTATVRALRECRAVRISPEDFSWLLRASPDFTIQLARIIGSRLQRTTHRTARARPLDRIVTLSATLDPVVQEFQADFEASIGHAKPGSSERPACQLLDIHKVVGNSQRALDTLHDADAAIIAASAAEPPNSRLLDSLLDILSGLRPRPYVVLVLLHRTPAPYRGTLPWLRNRRITAWHHVEIGHREDCDRLARRIVGRAIGLVLSGGGARGFAHIGVLKAFAETGTPVDAIAGSSMGAVIGALHAFGLSVPDIIAVIRRSFVERGGMPDYAIPYVALRTGASTNAYLKAAFGNARIEDLPIPFFSVSSNLNTAETVVHETGRLWRAVRSSVSVPGLLPPIRFRGGFLVDGGLLDNLPVRAMRDRLTGRVIASDVSVAVDQMRRSKSSRRRFRPFARAHMPSLGSILMRTVQLASVRDSRVSGVPADLYLNPPVGDIGMSDFERLDEIVERGADYARKQLAGWQG